MVKVSATSKSNNSEKGKSTIKQTKKKVRKPRAANGTKEGESIYDKLLEEGNNQITREHFVAWFVSYKQKMKKEAASSKKSSGLTSNQPLTAAKRKAILKALAQTELEKEQTE